MSWGCQKFHFREFPAPKVSSGLKEDEMGSQTPHYVRGGVQKIIFDLSRSLAPKLALVPGSCLYCNKGI